MASATNAINATLYADLKFNFIRDSASVATINRIPIVLEVHPLFPSRTVPELIVYAKSNPGKITLGTGTKGVGPNMAAELFKMMTHLDILHVPYRGSSAIYPDLMTGKVHVLFDNLPGSVEFVKTGKLKALAVTTAKRSAVFPDLPTVAETVPGFQAFSWNGLVVRTGTPSAIVEKVGREFASAVQQPQAKEALARILMEPVGSTPAEFASLIREDAARWERVVKAINLNPEQK